MKATRSALAIIILCWAAAALAGYDRPTEFTNRNSVANTRHNLTQRPPESLSSINAGLMDESRNDYREVCVYCHTPHSAASAGPGAQLPLWNRTIKATTYTTYGSTTLTQTITQPGVNSLSCLSCHDGQTAIDSIINMPGSGRDQASQATSQDDAFLTRWAAEYGGVGPSGGVHSGMNSGDAACISCHQPPNWFNATDFRAFDLGTDLRNDHPVGIRFPGAGPDYNTPAGTVGSLTYFDTNSSGGLDKRDIRFYDTGEGPEVECASCHDPHGVPSAGAGSTFIASFLRVPNAESGVCLTCHNK